jgi:hypothetical protein
MSTDCSSSSATSICGTHGSSRRSKESAPFRSASARELEEKDMRKYILPIVAVAMLGAAPSAMAYDSGGLISMDMAMNVASNVGIATVSNTQFAGDEWQIEGRDINGQYMEVDVDAATGQVLNVDR